MAGATHRRMHHTQCGHTHAVRARLFSPTRLLSLPTSSPRPHPRLCCLSRLARSTCCTPSPPPLCDCTCLPLHFLVIMSVNPPSPATPALGAHAVSPTPTPTPTPTPPQETLQERKNLRAAEKEALARGEMPETLQGWKVGGR